VRKIQTWLAVLQASTPSSVTGVILCRRALTATASPRPTSPGVDQNTVRHRSLSPIGPPPWQRRQRGRSSSSVPEATFSFSFGTSLSHVVMLQPQEHWIVWQFSWVSCLCLFIYISIDLHALYCLEVIIAWFIIFCVSLSLIWFSLC